MPGRLVNPARTAQLVLMKSDLRRRWTAPALSAFVALLSVAGPGRGQPVTVTGPATVQGAEALKSVFRIECGKSQGTAFLLANGNLITAAHVVQGCTDATIHDSAGGLIQGVLIGVRADKDLALVRTSKRIGGPGLHISARATVRIGATVAMWGFPSGYAGNSPLLGVGYVSGRDVCQGERDRLVLNGAINHGVSGGPALDAETGDVVGVMVSKIVPLSPSTLKALEVMRQYSDGMQYQVTGPDGRVGSVSEAQIVASVAHDLAMQVQLVVGCAATADDLRSFIQDQGLAP